jgi:class 3 adenylate cyclase
MLAGHIDRLDELCIEAPNEDSSKNGSKSNSNSGIDSSLSDSNATGSTPQSQAVEIIARKGSKQVFFLKIKMTVLLLLAAAIMVSTAVFISTRRGEIKSFEAAFNEYALKAFDTFKFNVERKLGAIDTFSVAITSLAFDSNVTWPYFTIPNYEYRAANARELANAASLAFLPFVTQEDRSGWEEYSVDNTRWIEDAAAFQTSISRRRLATPVVIENGISDQIYLLDKNGKAKVDDHPGPYFPMWQHYPVIPSIVNYDLLWNDNFHDGIQSMMSSKNAVIGKIWDLAETNDVFAQFLEAWESDSGLDHDDPISKLFYPVFDNLNSNHTLVAMLASVINWKTYFQNILPPHVNGVVVVLSNACDQTYTYNIVGAKAFLMGKGDLHDTHYDYLGQKITFEELIRPEDRRIERVTEATLSSEYCPYILNVYPSADLENNYVTGNATIYTVVIVVIFAFTGVLFLLYDFVVERRQRMVMKRALQSRAIVSSLFPAAVHERLFRNDDSTGSKHKGGGRAAKGFKEKLNDARKSCFKNFPHDSRSPQEHKPAHELRPIADLFSHTTVMFADIVGFTRWSSERDPSEVFTLLQTVYHAFDRIAKKRKVFKVETIGDCYVAATGLLDPQKDHALRMAKFANECMRKMAGLVKKLKDSLGEDTTQLCMRFGLHSGPVTAGVLRGDKFRFQLFGNTVNAAARMEHTGERNRIQITQETADLITEAGKGHWIFLRVDDVADRGGIQTYWVEPQSNMHEAKLKNAVPTRMYVNKADGTVDSSQRLIDWNVDLLKQLLKRIVAHRIDRKALFGNGNFSFGSEDGITVRDEITCTIALPKYDKAAARTDPQTVILGKDVEK